MVVNLLVPILMKFEMPTVEEFEAMASKNNEEIKKDLEESRLKNRRRFKRI